MLAKKRAAARGKNLGRRRRPTDHVAETIHRAAFKIDASEKRRGNALLAFAQKSVRLRGPGDVAGKQNHARRLNLREQGSEARRHLGPVEADDEELADLLGKPSSLVPRWNNYYRSHTSVEVLQRLKLLSKQVKSQLRRLKDRLSDKCLFRSSLSSAITAARSGNCTQCSSEPI